MLEMTEHVDKADILIGIASFNNARTIGHVVKAVDAGLMKYFPDRKAVIVNSDGGSTDGTPDIVRTATHDHAAIFLSHPVYPAHRISIPYNGIPGKGSAFRAIFQKAVEMGAEACCVVDADLRSITPEWIELLLSPIMKEGFDFVAPFYSRHKYDGTITNSIVYPMTQALYGKRIRQPIGGEFGFSGKLAAFYLTQNVWESHVARFGIDIWMTTEAIANDFKVCQTFLGAKIHDPRDPGADLSDMLVQVVVTLFNLTEKHYEKWKGIKGSMDVPAFGFRYHVGLEPVRVNIERMLGIFRTGIRDLVYPMALAGIMAGASVVLIETHPNPLIAKSDGFQGLFPEQFFGLLKACEQAWELRQRLESLYTPSAKLERGYEARVTSDKKRFFGGF